MKGSNDWKWFIEIFKVNLKIVKVTEEAMQDVFKEKVVIIPFKLEK